MLRKFLAGRFDPNSRLGVGLTIGAVLFAGLVWLFAGLLEEVLDNEGLVRWDERAATWLHAHATQAGLQAFAVITWLGSEVAWALIPIVALILWRMRRRRLLLLWIGANLGGKLLELALKHSVHRTRPIYGAAYLHGHSYSFPSGHAMGGMICYLTLAYIVSTIRERDRALTYLAAALIILPVGFSRVYLGVHYPSDVVGGYVAAGAWLALCFTVAHIAMRPAKLTASSR